jgi:hypothetical protein
MVQNLFQTPEHGLAPVGREAPFHQQQGAFFLILAAAHLDPGRLFRRAQLDEQVFQQAVAVEVPAYFQGEIIQAHHGIKVECIVIRPLIGREGVAFQDETARAGFPK